MSIPRSQTGEWLLITTFRVDAGVVITKGSNPQNIITVDESQGQYGQLIHRALGGPLRAAFGAVHSCIRRAVATRKTQTSSAIPIRGVDYRVEADPVLSGDQHPFAVWVNVHPADAPPPPPPLSGAWSWDNFLARPVMARYGPRIGELYGRPDLEAGRRYDVNTIVRGNSVGSGMDLALVANFLLSPTDHAQLPVTVTTDRGTAKLASLRAFTELVFHEDRPDDPWEWRGVTWDVTAQAPPIESAVHAAARASVGDTVWAATAFWWPLQLIDIAGERPAEIYIDPHTQRAVPHPASRGFVRRLIQDLDTAPATSTTVWLRTVDGDYAPYEVEVYALRGSAESSASVIVRQVAREVDAARDAS